MTCDKKINVTIADETLRCIDFGGHTVDPRYMRSKLREATDGAQYYPQSSLSDWQTSTAKLLLRQWSTLEAVEKLHLDPEVSTTKRIGVLNFAHPTSPGGEFRLGSEGQEESLARSSTLYRTLTTHHTREYYEQPGSSDGFATHAMIYSPSVIVFRRDNGDWIKPLEVDVLSCSPVDATKARKAWKGSMRTLREEIKKKMRERMGHILALFERKRVRYLILGSFGASVGNDVGMVADIWADLLTRESARFGHSFEQVVFAVPDKDEYGKFLSASKSFKE
ncbi:uncharacterized protein EV420DRAFT_1481508 [Desarmillaria tabescens]|uniref:Microbial-type PARG catalytic domain-containing protein n=1 Tax=Armillaria tabescens TaxID=1929756 RepID=A0AA39N2S7_ARMTA|nr:uncharacterized protein EV420DRAFT_1481508 [Desarmillaria tabescens]KAK0455269.1 hypothetical protein EV420DRAFT_1481508 [Desarmillaria tabescens]